MNGPAPPSLMNEKKHLPRSDRPCPLPYRLGLSVLLALGAHGLVQATAVPSSPPADAVEAATQALQAGMAEQAQQLVTRLRKQAPEDARVRFLQGVLQAQQGRTDQAIDTFRQLTRSHPQLSEPYNNLGVLLASKGQLAQARAAFEQALLTHPSLATAHRNLLDVQTQLAQQSYARALMLDNTRVAVPQLTLLAGIHSPTASVSPLPAGPVASGAATAAASPSERTAGNAAVSVSASAASGASVSRPATNASAPTPNMAGAKGSTAAPSASAPSALTPASGAASTSPLAASTTAALTAKPPAVSAVAKPAAAGVSAAAASPSPSAQTPTTDAREMQLREQLDAWARAWSRQDMKAYLAAYARDFQPPAGMNRTQWEADRQLKITSKKRIQVEITQLRISWREQEATAQFRQAYESDNLKVVSRKTMVWVLRDGQWRILRETTG